MGEPIPTSATPTGPRRRPPLDDPVLEARPEPEPGAARGPGAALEPAPGSAADLARAFRANAEALGALRDLQGEMVEVLRRGDRSELVLQNTQALNEAFRNLALIQRELLTQISAPRPRSPLVPLLLLGLLAVVLAGVWVLLDAIERRAPGPAGPDPLALAARERDAWKEGRNEGAAQSERELRRLEQRAEEAEARREEAQRLLDARQAELDEVARARRAAEQEREELAARVRHAQQEVLAHQALEDEVNALAGRLAVTDQELRHAMAELAKKRSENEMLRKKAVDYGLDLAPDPDASRAPRTAPGQDPRPPAAPAEPAEPAGPAAAPGAREALPPPLLKRDGPLLRDEQLTDRVRERLNQLLRVSGPPGGESWHVTRLDGVAKDRLADVIALRYDAQGRLLDHIEAREVRIAYDRAARRVEFHFLGGDRVSQSARQPLPAEGLRVPMATGEAARLWAGSGLTMVEVR